MHTKPFNRLLMFSGGGSRFGYYLGAYAALVDHQVIPDIILASCGGSLAAALVDIAPQPDQLKQLATSKTLHTMLQRIESKPPPYLHSHTYHSLKRAFYYLTGNAANTNSDHLRQELQRFALFQIENEDTQAWLDVDQLRAEVSTNRSASSPHSAPPAIAIVASRLVPDSNPAQLQQLVFFKNKVNIGSVNNKLFGLNENSALHAIAPHRIHAQIKYVYEWSLADAVRASIADMYYLPPWFIDAKDQKNALGWCLGGVIDLTPIELATGLADCVFAETKARYDRILAVPAIKRVFGFDPNQRLKQVLQFQPDSNTTLHWLPFADNEIALEGQHTQKQFNFRAGLISLVHCNYADFVTQMNKQWEYGYQRTQLYLNHHFN